MLRRLIRMLALYGCAMAAGCGVSASGTGLTAAFTEAARDAHRYITSDLVPAIGTARFPVVLATSRAKVKILQLKAASDADNGVWLILTMINAKSNESHHTDELTGLMNQLSGDAQAASSDAQATSQDVANERDQCIAEAEGWLSGNSSKVAALKAGPCLQQARRAAAILGR